MRFFPILAAFGIATAAWSATRDATRLDYKVVIRQRGGPTLDCRLEVRTTPPVPTHNRVKRPRYVGWQVRLTSDSGELPSALVAARIQRLLYLDAPVEGLVPREGGFRLNGRLCRFWQAQTPASVGAFVYLVEVAPNLLALSYLSASLPEGDLSSVEMHLEKVVLADRPAPAEEGTALLRTLRHWGTLLEPSQQVMETEQIR